MAIKLLRFQNIFCRKTEDSVGMDDLYLKVGGTTWWTGRANNGQTVDLRDTEPYRYDDAQGVEVALFEADSEGDDLLGSSIVANTVSGTPFFLSFVLDQADYRMRVIADDASSG